MRQVRQNPVNGSEVLALPNKDLVLREGVKSPQKPNYMVPSPRDPPVLKKRLRRVNFGTGSKLGTAVAKTQRRGLRHACFF